jgi:hypothetical protein
MVETVVHRPSFGRGWTFRWYSNAVSPDRSTLRTVLRDTFRSRAISLIVLPLIKCSQPSPDRCFCGRHEGAEEGIPQCPQKMDHDDPQKAGENVARAGCSGRRLAATSGVPPILAPLY